MCAKAFVWVESWLLFFFKFQYKLVGAIVFALVTSWIDLGHVRKVATAGPLALDHVASLNGNSSHHVLFRWVFLQRHR